MSLPKALNLVKGRLPSLLAEAAHRAAEANKGTEEVTVPGFGMWHVREVQSLRFTCEHRLIGCETAEREHWLKTQLSFLDQAVAASTAAELWQAYCITDTGRVSFLIDTGREVMCSGPFP